ncbi:helix-turn-helix domain-containing protein [Croceibacterium sp. TMG7-5b_MA50]|uniref:helix-turn-helix domain-containing protein n=1 Tax=Croceibacterium sp. TMG7-5b_MA50 TaxID=3121290 RepID=UPI0032220894
MHTGTSIEVRYFKLSAALQPYFTALYLFDFHAPGDTRISDCLYPEWAALRFAPGAQLRGALGRGPLQETWDFVCTGPTSRVLHFDARSCCAWGLGLQPAGWARFVDAAAGDFANRLFDGLSEPAFAPFAPLLDIVSEPGEPVEAKATRINEYLESLPPGPAARRADQVAAVHTALRDPAIANVSEIAERVGVGTRTLERICARWFGFPAKQELRRQRFLRSMARFMLADFRSWSDALDERYYDQAQFVRDFRSFMEMTPSEYAEMPHPVLHPMLAQRLVDQGVVSMGELARLKDAVVQPAGRRRN